MIEFDAVNEYGRPRMVTHDRQYPNLKGRIAIVLVEGWGQVAGVPAGEDSAGRQATRLATPGEVVTRAVETADLLVDTMTARGWVHEAPPWAEIKKAADAVAMAEAGLVDFLNRRVNREKGSGGQTDDTE